MEQRNLGHSGLRVSAVGQRYSNFGGHIERDETPAVLDADITSNLPA